jgi:catechol 2,3-dioxygenase-like lactoylglutathione lyase family enzyme
MNHVGIIVDDLPAAIAFFVDLGLELSGQMQMEDPAVDRLLALDGVRTEFAFVRTPDGSGQFELIKFLTPANQNGSSHAPANALGLRHVAFEVENIETVVAGLQARGVELVGELVQYQESWKFCYVRGPEGIIVELAEQIG